MIEPQATFRARLARRGRAWLARVAGFFASRAEAARLFASGAEALERAAEAVALAEAAERESDRRIAELSNEVRQLVGEKAALGAQLALRELEMREYALCMERNRLRVEAEIALEVARVRGTAAKTS